MLLGNLASGSGGNLISGSSLVGGPPRDRAELLLLSPAWPASGRWRERSAEPRPCRSFLEKGCIRGFCMCSVLFILRLCLPWPYTKEDWRCFQKDRCDSRMNVKLGEKLSKGRRVRTGCEWSGSKYFMSVDQASGPVDRAVSTEAVGVPAVLELTVLQRGVCVF